MIYLILLNVMTSTTNAKEFIKFPLREIQLGHRHLKRKNRKAVFISVTFWPREEQKMAEKNVTVLLGRNLGRGGD